MFYMKLFYLIKTVIRFHFEGGGGHSWKSGHEWKPEKFPQRNFSDVFLDSYCMTKKHGFLP